MQAPSAQAMTAAPSPLSRSHGVVIRQGNKGWEFLAQAAGRLLEITNRYRVTPLPPDRHAAKEQGGTAGTWQPTGPELAALPASMYVKEESNRILNALLLLAGCVVNLRPLRLHFFTATRGGTTTPLYVADKPCRLGAVCGCPYVMTLRVAEDGALVGKIVEDDTCSGIAQSVFKCVSTLKVMEATEGGGHNRGTRDSLVHKYSLRSSSCCFGRVNNCCGATCFKPSLVQDILDADGKILSNSQKMYGPGVCVDLFRCLGDMSTYVVEFPPGATEAQRALLLSAVLHMDYNRHEAWGAQDDLGRHGVVLPSSAG